MMMFSEQFMEQGSSVIEYEGKMIHRFYRFNQTGNFTLRFTFVNSFSRFAQAIIFHLSEFHGRLFINGKEVKKPKGRFPQLIFEKRHSPRQFEVNVILEEGNIVICNGSARLRDEHMWTSLYGGCAMIIEELAQNHFRFYCNDHENDDDFDDLIFELEIMEIQ